MQLAQLRQPLQRAASSSWWPSLAFPAVLSSSSLSERFAQLRLDNASVQVEGRRYASVKSQGHYKLKPKRTIPKKLGAKRTGDQYVIPGNIIYKQRGTIWHPGENTLMGRDHTIHAAVAGYVKYYRDPKLHPKRQYIGVTFKREDTLPYGPGVPRKRRLGMVAVPRRIEQPEEDIIGPSGIPRYVVRREGEEIVMGAKASAEEEDAADAGEESPAAAAAAAAAEAAAPAEGDAATTANQSREGQRKRSPNEVISARRIMAATERRKAHRGVRVLRLQPDYSYRETNWEIGRLVGPAGKVGGTGKQGSRKSRFRARRRRREAEFLVLGKKAAERAVRRKEHERQVAARRAVKEKELAELAAQEAAKKAAMKAEQEKFATKT